MDSDRRDERRSSRDERDRGGYDGRERERRRDERERDGGGRERERERRDDGRERSRSRERRQHRERDDRRDERRRSHSRSRSRSPRRQSRDDVYRPSSDGRRRSSSGAVWESSGGAMNAPPDEAEAHARVSKRENRLYVGNLRYDVTYKDLSRWMSGVFSEILVTPQGASKGCGIVEFATGEQARRAMADLREKMFMGRPVFLRPDREEHARFGAAPIPGRMGMALGEAATFGGQPANRNVFVNNVPHQASWQDLKDLMRGAGEVIRADVGMTADGRPKGNGTVVFVDVQGAHAAIRKFNGYDWHGNILEVREDRFAHVPGRGSRGRGAPRGGMRGGFARGGFTAAPGGGGFGMGGMSAIGGGMGSMGNMSLGSMPSMGMGMMGGLNGYGAEADAPEAAPAVVADPSPQIWVGNLIRETADLDLVELFETVAPVVLAEVLVNSRGESKGEGIVQFTSKASAQEAITRFNGYLYGGLNLDVQFSPRWHEFGPSAQRGGDAEGDVA